MNIYDHIFSVSELTREIRQTLESRFPTFWLRGELSGVVLHRSGHLYVTIKDAEAQISAVMWRSRVTRLDFRPQDGMEVLAYGNLTVYEKGGRYQFDMQVMQPGGRGMLAIEFEKLRTRLAAEGLFDTERKRQLPRFPTHIAVLTSPSGAAVRDILVTLARRGFNLLITFLPVKVQGDGAAEDIATGLRRVAALSPRPDLIIVGRGGGSIEDLWAFNEEPVVRAIAASPIPVIAGIGHETDITLADLAADYRAPTPTAAAEIATQNRNELKQQVYQLESRLARSISHRLAMLHEQLRKMEGAYGLRRVPDTLLQFQQRLDDAYISIERSIRNGLENRHQRLTYFESHLLALSPKKVLERGYSVVKKGDLVVMDAAVLSVGDYLELLFARGEASAELKEVKS